MKRVMTLAEKKIKWTAAQENAIDSRNGSVLVSAAAGSGKTAVLVERVIRRICDEKNPCPVDSLLVVTFTKAAAAEMKERINARLTELLQSDPGNRYLARQRMMLPASDICTIDSFCLKLVRANYDSLGITPDFRTLDDNEKKLLVKEAADKTLEELYEEGSKEFKSLTELLISGRTDDKLSEIIYKLYENACAYAFPKKWLNSVVRLYNPSLLPQQTPWGQKILRDVIEQVRYCGETLSKCAVMLREEPELEVCYLPAIYSDSMHYKATYNAACCGDWKRVKSLIDGFKPERLKSAPKNFADSPLKERVKSLRDDCKKAYASLGKEVCVTQEEFCEDTAELRHVIIKLFSAVMLFSKHYSELKEKQNAYDFSDISHMALALLVSRNDDDNIVRTDLAKELSHKYTEILIDEYQDTNKAQDMLFRALSDNEENLFIVGDVKQSIYGFRLAMPEIFLQKRKRLPDFDGKNYPARINLDENFRSRKEVTEYINYVFGRVMSEDSCGINYDNNESLKAGADYEKADFPCAELHIVDKSAICCEELPETCHIADVIKKLIDEKMPVKTKTGYRPIMYKDICILMRAMGGADDYFDTLTKKNIPVYYQKRGGFFQNTEINVMLSFLEIIDNPLQDVPLLSVLMSPLYGFTADDLAIIRSQKRNGYLFNAVSESGLEKCRDFIKSLTEYREMSTTCSVSDLLRSIYERTAYPSIVLSMTDGDTRRLNLLLLLQYAENYESNSDLGLSGFVRYLARTRDGNSSIDSSTGISEYADVVRIMSIHASKGLEFPVVIIAGCGNKINTMSQYDALLVDPAASLGAGIKRIINETGRVFETLQHYACRLAIRDSERAEELRILYVAMTRARERLIIVGSSDNPERLVGRCSASLYGDGKIPSALIKKATSYLDILIPSLMWHNDAKLLRSFAAKPEYGICKADFPLNVECVTSVSSEEYLTDDKASAAPDENMLEEIKKRTSYAYGYSRLSDYAAKMSASSVEIGSRSLDWYFTAKPDFLCKNDMTPAMRGTAAHRFLEICDLNLGEQSVENEIERLVSLGKLTENEASAIDEKMLEGFFKSEIFKRIKNSDKVYREQKFTIAVPLCELNDDVPKKFSSEKTVVQGVIDCAFCENGKTVVVDYKTDNVKDEEELKRRYSGQLSIYKRAAEEIFSQPVKETLIFSLRLNKTVTLDI
ncbi:MAG TPA: helicase-exonuclease AddAB subunit AddA [Ruminococcaceae bacterium]|nr:helicase-exonuclease AddAB subunit AddA [Oscillospiraceae bacterium]